MFSVGGPLPYPLFGDTDGRVFVWFAKSPRWPLLPLLDPTSVSGQSGLLTILKVP